MKETRFQIAKKDIISFFEKNPASIFTYTDISKILEENKAFWRLPINLTVGEFIQLLLDGSPLKQHDLYFPNRKVLRFTWGKVSPFQLGLSLVEKSYFSHYTSLFLHSLTNQIPKTIYINFEQAKKRVKRQKLLQKNIDYAFSKPARISHNTATFKEYKLCLLNGKFTNNLGVIEIETSEREKLLVTNIERTLIDIAVSPAYAGGVYEILKAYKQAKDKVSINKLAAMLKEIDYIYPHYQRIGLYLEKSGVYKESQLELLKKVSFENDFYLTHQMEDKEYSKTWRIYYPKGF